MNYNGSEYFYITNMQGDIIELVDINGNSVAKYKYDAWGNIIYQTGSMADENPYRYRGYRYDDDTGFYYLNSRYYNPVIGRFISGDALTGQSGDTLGHNMFAYGRNNPITNIDESGFLFESIKEWWSDSIESLDEWRDKRVNDMVEFANSQGWDSYIGEHFVIDNNLQTSARCQGMGLSSFMCGGFFKSVSMNFYQDISIIQDFASGFVLVDFNKIYGKAGIGYNREIKGINMGMGFSGLSGRGGLKLDFSSLGTLEIGMNGHFASAAAYLTIGEDSSGNYVGEVGASSFLGGGIYWRFKPGR